MRCTALAAEYGVHAAFACEAAPDAGVLAGLCDTLPPRWTRAASASC